VTQALRKHKKSFPDDQRALRRCRSKANTLADMEVESFAK
jgi:hypothetical protein